MRSVTCSGSARRHQQVACAGLLKGRHFTTSPPENEILRVQQTPKQVLELRPAVSGRLEARKKSVLFFLSRRPRERSPEKVFDYLPVGLAGGHEPTDAIIL